MIQLFECIRDMEEPSLIWRFDFRLEQISNTDPKKHNMLQKWPKTMKSLILPRLRLYPCYTRNLSPLWISPVKVRLEIFRGRGSRSWDCRPTRFFSFLIRRQFRSLCIGIVRNWSRSNINSNFSNAIVEFKQRKKSLFLRLIITNGTQKDDEKAKVVILSKHYPNLEIVRTFLKSWKSLKCCFIELKTLFLCSLTFAPISRVANCC